MRSNADTMAFSPSVLAISGASSTILQDNSGTAETFTITPGANQNSTFAGTVQNGSTASLSITMRRLSSVL